VTLCIIRKRNLPLSIASYVDNMTRELTSLGIPYVVVDDVHSLPIADVYWDPCLAGGNAPAYRLSACPGAYFATLHGVEKSSFTAGWKDWARAKISLFLRRRRWKACLPCVSGIITVSEYAKGEVGRFLQIEPQRIYPIYHGVNTAVFRPHSVSEVAQVLETYGLEPGKPYFLNVSQYSPKKNVDGVIQSYQSLSVLTRQKYDLVIVAAGYSGKLAARGVTIIGNAVPPKDLAALYSGCRAYIYPSFHETFGMTLVEAMSCGAPVITSNRTACPEIVGEAGLLVSATDVAELTAAMELLGNDDDVHRRMRESSLQRSRSFRWSSAANQLVEVLGCRS